ncbi:MAG: hypothetical protein V4675_11520 [Verrucomicrobiota bacterium]
MNKIDAIQRYRQLFDGLNNIILDWDPLDLSNGGKIRDEFSEEATSLLAMLPSVNSELDAAHAVHAVFGGLFSHQQLTNGACGLLAIRVYEWWTKEL